MAVELVFAAGCVNGTTPDDESHLFWGWGANFRALYHSHEWRDEGLFNIMNVMRGCVSLRNNNLAAFTCVMTPGSLVFISMMAEVFIIGHLDVSMNTNE